MNFFKKMIAMAAPSSAPNIEPEISTELDNTPSDDEAAIAAVPDARTRIAAILTVPQAQGRGDLARYLALSTDLSVATAIATLEASGQEAAPKQSRRIDADFEKAYRRADHAIPEAATEDQETAIQRILRNYERVTGTVSRS